MDTIVRQEDIQRSEAETFLQTPVEISVVETVKPKWWQFWKKPKHVKHTFSVFPLKIAQQQRIIKRLAGLDESPFHNNDNVMKAYNKLASENMDDIVYCAGVLLTDPRKEPSEKLLQFIKENFDNTDLETLWAVMAKQMHVSPFLNGIVLIKGIDVRTNPSA